MPGSRPGGPPADRLRIFAIFSDYDGTLAPDDVAPEDSKIPTGTRKALEGLAASVPIAIVTSKDHSFVRPRTPFASAWACASGLELVLADGRAFSRRVASRRLLEGLEYVRTRLGRSLAFEVKRSTGGEPLGFSADWRAASPPSPKILERTTAQLKGMGLTVAYQRGSPFLDVFGARPDKGKALVELKRLMGLTGSVLFIGNSTADNPAFDRADVGLCVERGQDLASLTCGFSIRYERLSWFFRSLERDGMTLALGSLRRNAIDA